MERLKLKHDYRWKPIINNTTKYVDELIKNFTLIKEKGIEYGGLKTLVKTRWISTYERLASILRLKPCLEK
ncbi:1246_t:CDS:2, partial [Entrophospora sp. SA101]